MTTKLEVSRCTHSYTTLDMISQLILCLLSILSWIQINTCIFFYNKGTDSSSDFMEGCKEELGWLWFENFCLFYFGFVFSFFEKRYDYIISPFAFGFGF